MRDLVRLPALFALSAGGILAGIGWWPGVSFVVVAAGYVIAQILPMPTPSGRNVSMAPALAGAVALVAGGSPILVLATGAASLPVSYLLVQILHGRRATDIRFPAEPAGVAAFGAVFAAASVVLGGRPVTDPLTLGAFLVAVLVGYLTAAAVGAIAPMQGRSTPRRLLLLRALGDWPAYATLYSAAALYAISVPVMGVWSIPLAGLPYAFGHLSLHRLQATRHTYTQTIRALGSIPEAGGLTPAGHAARSAELAVAVGSELGLSVVDLDRAEYAALLHDIGRLVLANPVVASGEYTASDVAGWSAAIIGEAKYLEPVSEVVAHIHDPYRRPGQHRDDGLPRAAQVVRVVTAYDEGLVEAGTPLEAIETLHRGAAYDFDPEVVMALRRVLERRGTIVA